MGIQFKGGYCNNCDASRKVERKTANHILHLILTILTAGFWLIIWVLVAIRIGGWRCSSCGSKRVTKVR